MGFFKKNFSKQNLFAIAVLLILFFLLSSLGALKISLNDISDKNSSMIKEIGMIREANMSFGNDLNEVRKYLLLPTKQYFQFEEEVAESVDNEKNTDKLQLQLFNYIDFVGAEKKNEEFLNRYGGYIKGLNESEKMMDYLKSVELKVFGFVETDGASFISFGNDKNELLKFYLDKAESVFVFKSPLDKKEVSFENFDEFEEYSINYLKDNKDRIIVNLKSLEEFLDKAKLAMEDNAIIDVMKSEGFSFSDANRVDEKIYYSVNNKNGDSLAEIILDEKELKILLKDLANPQTPIIATDLSSSLVPFLKKLNSLSGIAFEVEETKKKILDLMKDEGFKYHISEIGLKIDEVATEDDKRIYFKIYDKDGNHHSSIVIEKTTAIVNIVSPDGTNAENLLFFEPEDKKKTLEIPENIPEYSDDAVSEKGTFNILLAGKHGNLTDTMIFTHINENTRKIKMISLPRDLFYNGRKLNSYSYFYGMDELKNALSEMTGYKLDKYILIDMYAFIDVIDLIGGVEVTLEKAVVDPTYRTVDNGVVGTLHYKPGTYHLGGKEALRLARTRHTSSDFARAERQQLILKSLQNKAKNFGFGDADTFYKIARSVLSKTSTDVKFDEAIAYYFKYQGFEIDKTAVMSSGNVLYVPPYTTASQCQAKIAAAEEAGTAIPNCMNENQAYTLLPKNNNWNVVKWFFEQNFEEEIV